MGNNNKRILLVEDQPTFLEAVECELKYLDYQTVTATNGFDAFKKYNEDRDNISLILSDIRMPNWDGIRLLTAVRRQTTELPFIFMTGFSDTTVAEALALGADRVVGKPFDPHDLEHELSEILKPSDEFWRTPVSGAPKLEISLDINSVNEDRHFGIGRSGAFVGADICPALTRMEGGDIVGLDLRFANGPVPKISGKGEVKWVNRFNDSGVYAAGCGLLFRELDETSIADLLAYKYDRVIIPTIPTIRNY